MKNTDDKFYVLGVSETPWVLESFDTRARAQGAIRWQNSPDGRWVIAKRTGADTFISDDNAKRTFTVQRGPYTLEAFENFKAMWLLSKNEVAQ